MINIKIKIKKIVAIIGLISIIVSNINSSFAATTIGTASVTGFPAFDSNIIWNDSFPGSATGTITGIKIKSRVLPTISMQISASEIDLGTLNAGIEASGSLNIEVGTNAANGVTITARSGSGGLTNISNNSIQINNLVADGIAESYKFSSTVGTHDSTANGYIQSSNMSATEVNNTTTEHIIYSTNKPEQIDGTNADVTFNVSTTTNAQTAAGDYEDYITFTIVGNF